MDGILSIEIIGARLWKVLLFTHIGGLLTGIAFILAENYILYSSKYIVHKVDFESEEVLKEENN